MFVYSCKHVWEDMLTCIYEAWSSGHGHQNIALVFDGELQYSLLHTYIHVDADAGKAAKVKEAIESRVSKRVYEELTYCSMAYEADVLDVIYRVMILCFAYGAEALEYVQYRDVMRFKAILKRVQHEVNRFQEFSRFHAVGGNVYVAHIEPKSRLVVALGPIFTDRMPSEHWMVIDDVHKEAVIHPKDAPFYLKQLSKEEYARLLKTEEHNDVYNDLWQVFFDSIAIEQRRNEKCQTNLFPLWARKHAVEFM